MNALTNAAAQTAGEENDDTIDHGADEQAQIEERARRIGWVPKDEFKGDPAKWTSAADFLEWGERLLPVVQDRNRKLNDQIDGLARINREVLARVETLGGELKESRTTFQEFRERTAGIEQRAYERAREELRQEMRQAVKDADPAAFDAAETKLQQLEKTAPKPVTAARGVAREDDDAGDGARGERREGRRQDTRTESPPQVSATAKEWIEANPWFKSDPDAGAEAVALHGANLARNMSEDESLKRVRASMERLRPDLFENDRRRAPGAVTSPSGGGPRRRASNGRGFDDLPAEAKAAYERFHRQDPKFTKEMYLADYAWDA
jgi:hypothetical protein